MSKNLIEYSSYLFDIIVKDALVLTKDKMRVAKNVDKDSLVKEIKDFRDIAVEDINYILPGVKIAGVSLREKQFILLVGINDKVLKSDLTSVETLGITLMEPHTGHLLALVKDAKLNRNDSHPPGFYEENIFSQQDDVTYKGHSLQDLILCIEPFLLFEIAQDSLLYCRNHRDVGQIVCSFFSDFFVLPFDNLAPLFQNLLITGGCYLRSENIFNSLTSAHWRHSFLELYRCIEALYSLPRAITLRNKLNLKVGGAAVAKACYSELGWKRKEEDSIKRLFKLLPNSTAISAKIEMIELFSSSKLDFSTPEIGLNSYEKLGELVYRLRNSLVHHLELDDEFIPQNENDWLLILGFMLSAVEKIYATYDVELQC